MRKFFSLFSVILIMMLLQPAEIFAQTQKGKASYYGSRFAGRRTASGEIFNPKKFTAAHRSWAFNTKVLVTNLHNNRSIVVRINDRGPYARGRIIDLSRAAAQKLGFIGRGVASVRIQVVSKNTPITGRLVTDIHHLGAEPEAKLGDLNSYEEKLPRKGYGIRIGSYLENKSLTDIVHKLDRQYDEPVFVKSVTIGTLTFYHLFLGELKTEMEARDFKDYLRETYSDAKIINYEAL